MPRTLPPRTVAKAVVQMLTILKFPGPNSAVTKTHREVVIPSLKQTAVSSIQAAAGLSSLSWRQVGGPGRIAVLCKSLVPGQWLNYAHPADHYEAYFNPAYRDSGKEYEEQWEECPSVPGVLGLVARAKKVKAQYIDESGEDIERELEGFQSRVYQHEADHCAGVILASPASAGGRLKLAPHMDNPELAEIVKDRTAELKDLVETYLQEVKRHKSVSEVLRTLSEEQKTKAALASLRDDYVEEFLKDFADVLKYTVDLRTLDTMGKGK